MCGICGIVGSESGAAKTAAMNGALRHRGPDSEGSFEAPGIAASMRRLSIIDVSGGSQPLWNEDKSISVVANGEIYNFVELREELTGRGHLFSTGSDCETIVHAYEEYGRDFAQRLRGMFAFCLHDRSKGITVIGRDRLGEKPIYLYSGAKGEMAFSSELKSILELVPRAERKLDLDSLFLYFHYGYVPEPRSIIAGIRKLPPATLLWIDHASGETEEATYWDMAAAPATSDVPARIVREELERIERISIRSDVPVGIALSGGIDSSAIALLAARYSKEKLHAFSVGYPDYPATDESNLAEKLAEKLGMAFHRVPVHERDFLADFDRVALAMDDPVADIAAYGYFAVSRAARAAQVPVLLAGFGGDELFWGYEWVRTAARYSFMKRSSFGRIRLAFILLFRFWKEIVRKPSSVFEWIGHAFSGRALLYELTPLWRYARLNASKAFSPSFLSSVDRKLPLAIETGPAGKRSGLTITELISRHWLIGNCIDLGDRMSMAHSIELRLPLVDYRLFEIAAGLRKKDPQDFLHGHKVLLQEALADLLPKEISERKKSGFTPPSAAWTRSLVAARSGELSNGYLVKSGALRREFMADCLSNIDKNLKFLYTALVFEAWAKAYLPKL
jgi:asparagine synthase (glutamine-hydrolysing)